MRHFNGKGSWARPLADFVDPCVAPALAHHGFGAVDLVTVWPEIVGERVASYAEPIRLQWPRGAGRVDADGRRVPATLILRVEGGGALELQHIAPVVVERINAHLGWRCVGRLAMRQGPLAGRRPPRRAVPPPQAAALETAERDAAGVADSGLREALVRLGARVLDGSSR